MTTPDYFALVDPNFYADNTQLRYVHELSNLARTEAYLSAGMHPEGVVPETGVFCPTLPSALGAWNPNENTSYSTPAADGAPWYEATNPATASFAGLILTEMTGLDTAPSVRAPIERPDGGSDIGNLGYTERTIDFEGVLVGRTCCATAAGYRWLSKTLLGKCAADCFGFDLWFLECCPDNTAADCLPDVPNETSTPWLFSTDVGIIEGPEVLERLGESCGNCRCAPLMRVRFTLVSGNPFLYGSTTSEVDSLDLSLTYPADACADGVDIKWGETANCDELSNPLSPFCDTSLPPPQAPLRDSCLCTPLAIWRTNVVSEITQGVQDRVPRVTLTAGAVDDVHNIMVRFGSGDCDTLEVCDWDDGFAITYMPAGSTLVFDAARRDISLTLDDGTVFSAEPYIYSINGTPVDWPVLGCQEARCMVVDVDAWNMPDDLTVSLDLIDRYY